MNIGTHIVDELYTIRDLLREGPLGTTYLATDRSSDATLVIKPIPDEITQDQSTLVWFQQRYQRLKSISHPALHTRYNHAFDQATESHYLTTSYVPGEHLGKWLKRQKDGHLEPQKALSMIRRIVEALDRAHQAGLPHLGLKPENIIVTPVESLVITDCALGYARQLPAWKKVSSDQDALQLVSPFTAPEIIRSLWIDHLPESHALRQAIRNLHSQPPGPAADMFALGALLFTMLTGHAPFTPAHYLEGISRGVMPSLSMPTAWPKALQVFILQAMQLRPENRFADITTLLETLITTEKLVNREMLAQKRQMAATEQTESPAVAATAEEPKPSKMIETPRVEEISEETFAEVMEATEETLGEPMTQEVAEPVGTDLMEEVTEAAEVAVAEAPNDEPVAEMAEEPVAEESLVVEMEEEPSIVIDNAADNVTPKLKEGELPIEMHEEAILELTHGDLLDEPFAKEEESLDLTNEELVVDADMKNETGTSADFEVDAAEIADHKLHSNQPEDRLAKDSLMESKESSEALDMSAELVVDDQVNSAELARDYELIGEPINDEAFEQEEQVKPKRRGGRLLKAAAMAGITAGAGLSWFLLTQEPSAKFHTVELQPALITENAEIPQVTPPEELTAIRPESDKPELMNTAVSQAVAMDNMAGLDQQAALTILRRQLKQKEKQHREARRNLTISQTRMIELEQSLKATQQELANTKVKLNRAKGQLAMLGDAREEVESLRQQVVKLSDSKQKMQQTAKQLDSAHKARASLKARLEAAQTRYLSAQAKLDAASWGESESVMEAPASQRKVNRKSARKAAKVAKKAVSKRKTATTTVAKRRQPAEHFTTTHGTQIYVQVASHKQRGVADEQRDKLAKKSLQGKQWPVKVEEARVNGETYHRVRFGPLASVAEAESLSATLFSSLKLDSIMVRKDRGRKLTTTPMMETVSAPMSREPVRKGYSVQIASFTNPDAAAKTQKEIEALSWHGNRVAVFQETKMVDGRLFHRVRLGPFNHKSEAILINDLVHDNTDFPSIVIRNKKDEVKHYARLEMPSRGAKVSLKKAMATPPVSSYLKSDKSRRVDDGFMVQLGAYTSADAASSAKRKLDDMTVEMGSLPLVQETTTLAGQDVIRLRLGPFKTEGEAKRMKQMVQTQAGMYGGTILAASDW
uniref:SPOR domain-containing protein n=1 Tax=Magnetococcus massalia (strain MO-1) TaxID=451514 RepID=A0A1S7LM86_MAGMO|nr:Conserved protein of unknown function [Candidatus Magnetococcus massalia]